jgi:hypothetical protein
MADCLQDLLDLSEKPCLRVSAVQQERLVSITIMVDRHRQFDGSKVAGTLGHILFTGGTFEVSIDGAQMRVVETFLPGPKTRFILQFTM